MENRIAQICFKNTYSLVYLNKDCEIAQFFLFK